MRPPLASSQRKVWNSIKFGAKSTVNFHCKYQPGPLSPLKLHIAVHLISPETNFPR
jgi:hypothetical protein